MAKTNSEKKREQREKLKKDPVKYQEALEIDKRRKAKARQIKKTTMTQREINKSRNADRIRQARHRARVKAAKEVIKKRTQPYRTPQSLGRAVSRVKRRLPYSPRKREVVITTLAREAGIKKLKLSPKKSQENNLYVQHVTDFYSRDEVSRMTPGRRDSISVRNEDGTKSNVQKRYLVMNILEAHALFKQEYPDLKVGKSKFAAMRPKHVLCVGSTPHNTCLCKYHENIDLLLSDLPVELNMPRQWKELLKEVVCDINSHNCMFGLCEKCKNLQVLDMKYPIPDNDSEVTWFEWGSSGGRTVKIIREDTLGNVLDCLKRQLPHFLVHCYLCKVQSAHFKEKREHVDSKNVVVQLDFSENYTVQFENEIQSAYWHQEQITIFTVVAWITSSKTVCYTLVSDYLAHDKAAVATFLDYVIADLKLQTNDVRNINFFSDGAASQFKQRFNFINLTTIFEKYGIKCTWNFFATSHGKGAVDGVGGTIKREVWKAVKSGKEMDKDCCSAEAFAKLATKVCKGITVVYISGERITAMGHEMATFWEDTKPLPSTQTIHYVEPITRNVIRYKLYSVAEESKVWSFKECEPAEDGGEPKFNQETLTCSMKVEDFGIFQFQSKSRCLLYAGVVLEKDMLELRVSVLKRKGDLEKCAFVFPEKEDLSWIDGSQIVSKLGVPIIDSRGHHTFKVTGELLQVN